ncbi:alpha/beta-hydrolase [Xylariaceae sp. FL0662B]|nr:alpha/beta-hydrolase [Xylariaceae sp. FL0662B]
MDFSQWGTTPSEEWLSFAQANPNALQGADHLPPLKQQELANNLRANIATARLAASGLGPLVTTQDHAVPTRDGSSIVLRAYRPISTSSSSPPPSGPLPPALVYFHGGGYIFGSPETERFQCSWMAHSLGASVLHACYRHTPQVSGLTPWHDAQDAFDWVAAHADALAVDAARIVVAGLSAGANLSASLSQREARRARDTGEPCRVKGQVLGIPHLVHREAFPFHLFAHRERTSPVQCEEAAILHKKRMDMFMGLLGRDVDPFDRTWSPGLAGEEELRDVPPAAFLVCGWDPLRDEGLSYAQKLKNAGVRTKVHIFPGMPHNFGAFPQVPSHKRWNEVMLESIRWAKADEGEWNVEVLPAPPSAAGAAINALEPATTNPPLNVQGGGNSL